MDTSADATATTADDAMAPSSSRPAIWFYLLAAGAVLAFVLFVTAFTRRSRGGGASSCGAAYRRHVLSLTEHAARSAAAAKQSGNPLFAVISATEALAAVRTARVLVPNGDELNDLVQLNVENMTFVLEKTQNDAVQQLLGRCPALQLSPDVAAASGWAP